MTKRKTAAELLAELASDNEYLEARKAKDEELQKRKAEWAVAEAPLVDALRSMGLDVHSAWDLVNTTEPYPEAIPVLFEHLRRPYPERVVEGILRALAVTESRPWWSELRNFFEAAPAQATSGLRWAAGCALGAAANDGVISDVLRLASDPKFGFDRATLLPALARSDDARAKMLLHELRDDPVLAKEVKKLRRVNRKPRSST